MENLVRICGAFYVLFGLFHVGFPKTLRWKEELPNWSAMNRATIRILNHCLMIFWFILGFIYLIHAKDMVTTSIGRSILIGMVVFWIIRIGILQPFYLGIKSRMSISMIGLFSVALVLNIIPLARGLL